jgi:hypothetical protein
MSTGFYVNTHKEDKMKKEKRQDYDHSKLTGMDVNVEIALKEYGLAWIEKEDEILFYYGINTDLDEMGWFKFDFCTISKNINAKEEYNWADFDAVSRYCDHYDWGESLLADIECLVHYYGFENVFGSSYWEGLTYDEIINT